MSNTPDKAISPTPETPKKVTWTKALEGDIATRVVGPLLTAIIQSPDGITSKNDLLNKFNEALNTNVSSTTLNAWLEYLPAISALFVKSARPKLRLSPADLGARPAADVIRNHTSTQEMLTDPIHGFAAEDDIPTDEDLEAEDPEAEDSSLEELHTRSMGGGHGPAIHDDTPPGLPQNHPPTFL